MRRKIVTLVLSVAVIASLMIVGCAPEVAPPPEEEAPPEEGEPPPPEVFPELYEALGRVTVRTGATLLTSVVYRDPDTEGFSISVAEITPFGEFWERNFVVSSELEELPDIRPTVELQEFRLKIFERDFRAVMRVDPTNPSGAVFWFQDKTTAELTSLAIMGYRGFPVIAVAVAVFLVAQAAVGFYAIKTCTPISQDFEFGVEGVPFLSHYSLKVHQTLKTRM